MQQSRTPGKRLQVRTKNKDLTEPRRRVLSKVWNRHNITNLCT